MLLPIRKGCSERTTSKRTSEGKQTSFAITAFSQRKNPQSSKVYQHVGQLYKSRMTSFARTEQMTIFPRKTGCYYMLSKRRSRRTIYFEYLHSLKFCTLCEVILKLLRIVGGIMRPGIISAINVNTLWHTPLSRSKTQLPNWRKAQCHWLGSRAMRSEKKWHSHEERTDQSNAMDRYHRLFIWGAR